MKMIFIQSGLKEIARIYSKKSSEIIFIKKFGYTWLIIFVILLFVSIDTYYVRSVVRNYHPKDHLYIDFHDNDFLAMSYAYS